MQTQRGGGMVVKPDGLLDGKTFHCLETYESTSAVLIVGLC